jgi:hypothetical protein
VIQVQTLQAKTPISFPSGEGWEWDVNTEGDLSINCKETVVAFFAQSHWCYVIEMPENETSSNTTATSFYEMSTHP